MKSLSLILIVIFLLSCKSERKINIVDKAYPERAALSMDSQIFLGNRLFSEKTCIKCHSVSQVKKGPSIKNIVAVYKEKNGNIVSFLKGETDPIMDATPEQKLMMQENIDGFLKTISDEEMNSIATYMIHVDELYPE